MSEQVGASVPATDARSAAPASPPAPAAPATRSGLDLLREAWRVVKPSVSHRLIGIDIARGLAMIGMITAHVGMSFETFDFLRPNTWGDLVNGRSSILFAILAGVSISLLSRRGRAEGGLTLLQVRIRLLVRAALIFAVGGLLASLGTGIAIILEVYAVLFAVSIPFLLWSARALVIAAGAAAVVAPVLHLLLQNLSAQGLLYGGSAITELVVFGMYPAMIWIAFLLFGMAVGRLELDRRRVQATLLAVGAGLAVLGYGLGSLAGAAFGAADSGSEIIVDEDWGSVVVDGEGIDFSDRRCYLYGDDTVYCDPQGGWPVEDPGIDPVDPSGPGADVDWAAVLDLRALATISAHSGSPFEVVGSSGFALVVIALCLLAPAALQRALYPIAAVGSMPLTAYTAHVIWFGLAAEAIFAGEPGILWWFIGGTIVGCTLWRLALGRGPLEVVLSGIADQAARVPRATAGVTPGVTPPGATSRAATPAPGATPDL